MADGVDGTAQSSGEPVSPVIHRTVSVEPVLRGERRAREPAPRRRDESRGRDPARADPSPDFFSDLMTELARGPSVPQTGARILHGSAMGMGRPVVNSHTDEEVRHAEASRRMWHPR